jgi:hypothetical protein
MSESARQRGAIVVAAVVAAVAAGAMVIRALRPAASSSPPPAAAAPARAADALVVSADEGVQRTVPGGAWAPARAGDTLAVADSIRTGAAGNAELELGRGARVTVAQRTEVTVRELTAAVQRVGLIRGRIGVNVEPDGTRVLRVEDAAGQMSVTASGGRLGVVAAPGSLAVVAQEGGAVLESAGAAVTVPAGHQATAWRGIAPVAPTPVPRKLLMRVVEAMDARRASVCNVVQVDLAAEVLVNGEPVETPPDGRVVLRVPPRGRRRGAELVIRHASGEEERQLVPCWRDEADVSDLEVRWDGGG